MKDMLMQRIRIHLFQQIRTMGPSDAEALRGIGTTHNVLSSPGLVIFLTSAGMNWAARFLNKRMRVEEVSASVSNKVGLVD